MTSYLVFMATLAGIYALLSLGLVTIWGQGGMVNLGLVGFYAVGAYTSALLSSAGVPIGISLVCAALMAGAVGVVLSYVTRPLRGDYLAIVSLGFAEVIRLVATNEKWLTGGSDGLSGIRSPLKFELGAAHPWFYLLLVWAIVGATALCLTRLFRSPYGRALRAVRDDEQVAAVAGKPVLQLKLKTFFVGAALSGIAGGVYAHLTSYIAPDGFVPLLTIYIFLAATAGGYTRVIGAIVGSLAVVALLESTRFVAAVIPGLTAVQVASLREFVIAISLIAIMQLKPEGVFQSVNQKARADSAPRRAKASAAAESEPSSNVLASRA
ncbi:amino acid/amide ABC transporter membrane protein 2, HAAT family [Variovorax sp. CF079]|uniref:branched-chain amino acid ABC transporter permease n=1 Tax=Variovorax sp. CF079 TaxID=1882774 RepID=UPI000886DE8D|nr:branched-chain amino acid ABC transporter permease [Variovorax sp. CF079]SDE93297.1 amino acid/amide ABC transporter membrane protein 2, HAAT family [Variovorax sp. CF079]